MGTGCARTLELRIPADTRYISLVRRGVRSIAESMGFPREDVADVEVAVSEAVTNSVIHGSTTSSAVVVRCRALAESLVVDVVDQGACAALPPPTHPQPAEETGRGLYMMQELVDECRRSRTPHGLRVRLTKQRR